MSDSDNWRLKQNKPITVYQSKSRYQEIEKLSYGVACCRYRNCNNTRIPEILVIRKRHTYALSLFVHGKYDAANTAIILKILNKTTIEEKHEMLSLNFIQLWYRIWSNTATKTASYVLAKNKFESTFVIDGGKRLQQLIAKSTNVELEWEIPKGRKKNKLEYDIHCAVREFQEETQLEKKMYKLFPTVTKSYSYIDDGVKYTNMYYFAYMRLIIEPKVDFTSRGQVDEISGIKWMSMQDLQYHDPSGRLALTARPLFNYMKKYAKIT